MENKLPKGWTSCPLKDVVSSRKGKKPNFVINHAKKGYDPYILIDELEGNSPRTYANDPKIPRATENDVLLVWDGSIGKCASGLSGAVGSTIAVLSPKNGLNTKYLEYFIKRSKNYITETSTGSGLQHVNKSFLKTLEIPLPPYGGQKCIADKLDVLLAKVKDAQSRLDKISLILKRFRQSVLAAACSGRLTSNWRKQEKMKLEQWPTVILGKVADSRLGKMLDKAKNVGKPMRYLRNINVRWFTFNLTDLAFIRATPEDKKEFAIRDGDLLICEGGEPGRCAVWDSGNADLIFQKAIHRVRLDNTVSAYWLALNIKNDANSSRLEEYFTGSTIKHLTGKALERYEFSLPSIDEQYEIVRRVKELFALADKIETRYIKAQGYIDKLEQSILAKAFRGELVK